MRIILTRGTLVAGHPDLPLNTPIELPDHICRYLIDQKRATVAPELEPQRIEVREPAIENRDPQPVEVNQTQPKRLYARRRPR